MEMMYLIFLMNILKVSGEKLMIAKFHLQNRVMKFVLLLTFQNNFLGFWIRKTLPTAMYVVE